MLRLNNLQLATSNLARTLNGYVHDVDDHEIPAISHHKLSPANLKAINLVHSRKKATDPSWSREQSEQYWKNLSNIARMVNLGCSRKLPKLQESHDIQKPIFFSTMEALDFSLMMRGSEPVSASIEAGGMSINQAKAYRTFGINPSLIYRLSESGIRSEIFVNSLSTVFGIGSTNTVAVNDDITLHLNVHYNPKQDFWFCPIPHDVPRTKADEIYDLLNTECKTNSGQALSISTIPLPGSRSYDDVISIGNANEMFIIWDGKIFEMENPSMIPDFSTGIKMVKFDLDEFIRNLKFSDNIHGIQTSEHESALKKQLIADLASNDLGNFTRLATKFMKGTTLTRMIITASEHGAVIIELDKDIAIHEKPPIVNNVVSPGAAGDSLVGTFLAQAHIERWDIHNLDETQLVELLRRSLQFASLTVQQPGTNVASLSDYEAAIGNFQPEVITNSLSI